MISTDDRPSRSTRDRRGAALDELAAAFNRPTSLAVHNAYREALAGLTEEEFVEACRRAMTGCDRWPVPKVLLALAREERHRLRLAVERQYGVPQVEPRCPACGVEADWHQFRNSHGAVVERRLIRHREDAPCARYNREWV